MSSLDPNLGLRYGWALGESGWNTGMDANLKKLGALVQLSVAGVVNTPTVTAAGTRYIVGTSPTGAFAGQAGAVAVRVGSTWEFYTPTAGWSAYNTADGKTYIYSGGLWSVPVASMPAQPFLEAAASGTWAFDNSAWTKVQLPTVVTDTANAWDASGNTDYIIPRAGLYLVQGVVRPLRSGANAMPDSTAFAIGIGATPADGDDVVWGVSPGVAAAIFTLNIASLRRYSAGDRTALFAKHGASGDVAISRARFRVLRVSD